MRVTKAAGPTRIRRSTSWWLAVVLVAGQAVGVLSLTSRSDHAPDLGAVVSAVHATRAEPAPPPASSTSVPAVAPSADASAIVALRPEAGGDVTWVRVGSGQLEPASVSTVPGSTARAPEPHPVTELAVGVAADAGHEPQITLARVDGETASAPVAVTIPDSVLAGRFGADYASRVVWWQSSGTADARHPAAGTAVVARRDAAAKSAVLYAAVSGTPTVLHARSTATSSTGTGTYAATSLHPASSWQVSTQTGDFSWSYPMRIPPAAAGRAPSLALAYDSQDVDGETGSTNNQPGVVGDGWNLAGGGFVERSYVPCSLDDGATGARKTSGDECWHSDNATVSFGGHSVPAILDTATRVWKLQDDDNSRLDHLTGTSNGTHDGDYWRLTTTDGTQYYFGLNTLPGYTTGSTPTRSTFTAPVYGNDPKEPCHGATFASSSCTQAWRWNLDYVVDPHQNAEALYYTPS